MPTASSACAVKAWRTSSASPIGSTCISVRSARRLAPTARTSPGKKSGSATSSTPRGASSSRRGYRRPSSARSAQRSSSCRLPTSRGADSCRMRLASGKAWLYSVWTRVPRRRRSCRPSSVRAIRRSRWPGRSRRPGSWPLRSARRRCRPERHACASRCRRCTAATRSPTPSRRFSSRARGRRARLAFLLLLGRLLDDAADVPLDLGLDERLDLSGERREGLVVRAVRSVGAGELEEPPALRLERLRRMPVVAPAIAETEEALERGRQRDEQAEREGDPGERGGHLVALNAQADERRHDDPARDRDHPQAVVAALRPLRLLLQPEHLIEPAGAHEPLLQVAQRRQSVDQGVELLLQPRVVRLLPHPCNLPPERICSTVSITDRPPSSRTSAARTSPESASVRACSSELSPRSAAASRSAVRPLPSATTTRRAASTLSPTSRSEISPPFTSSVSDGRPPARTPATRAIHGLSSPQSAPGTSTTWL